MSFQDTISGRNQRNLRGLEGFRPTSILLNQTSSTRLAAVSYLNTLPLVWGFLTGPQRSLAEMAFLLPADCADRLAAGEVDAGLVPVVEAQRQGLPILGDCGIACRGAVTSILLISKIPAAEIRTLAADTSSRSSVMLARILLAGHFRNDDVAFVPAAPDLDRMLAAADAALIIGDPALRLSSRPPPGLRIYDLGEEWWKYSALPMVFAVWGGRISFPVEEFRSSLEYGRAHIQDYVEQAAAQRGIPAAIALEYLVEHIRYDIGPEERRGMSEYLKAAAIMESIPA